MTHLIIPIPESKSLPGIPPRSTLGGNSVARLRNFASATHNTPLCCDCLCTILLVLLTYSEDWNAAFSQPPYDKVHTFLSKKKSIYSYSRRLRVWSSKNSLKYGNTYLSLLYDKYRPLFVIMPLSPRGDGE